VYLAIFRGSAIRSEYDALGLGRKPKNGLPYSKGPYYPGLTCDDGLDAPRWRIPGVRRASRSRSIRAETCTTPQPKKAVSEARSSIQRVWFSGGIDREYTPPSQDEQDYIRIHDGAAQNFGRVGLRAGFRSAGTSCDLGSGWIAPAPGGMCPLKPPPAL
jgi:hypothetical protein